MVIEGYRLVRRIGAGGMGAVHEALDADGNRVAVKILHEAIAADPAARQRLRREVELLHRVRGDGVARVLDAEVDGVTAFIVTELIDGPTLEEDIRAEGRIDGEELADLARGLAEGLQAIHAAGITHRDLKPGNVMLSSRGPVIIDFGIAQVADDVRLTQTGMVTGTPGYLDPDVIAGADPGPDGDWWAWAAVLTFAATGRPPFGRGTFPAVLARVSIGAVDTTGLPDDLGRALRAALDPDPARRLAPGDVLAALDGDWDRPALARLLAPPAPPPATARTDLLPPGTTPPTFAPAAGSTWAMPNDSTRVMPGEGPGLTGPTGASGGSTRLMPGDGSNPFVPGQEPDPIGPAGASGGSTRLMPGQWPDPTAGSQGPFAPGQAVPTGPPQPQPWPGTAVQGQMSPPGYPMAPGWAGTVPAEAPAWARSPRRRTGTVAALGMGITAFAVVVPGWWVIGVVAVVAVLGAVGRGSRRLRAGRMRRGRRRGDAARAWLGSPVHLLSAVGATVPGLLIALVVAGGGWWITRVLVDPPDESHPWLLWGAAALGLGILWTTPPSGAAREGARLALGALPQPLRMALVLLALVVVAVVALLIVFGSGIDPLWDPFSDPVP